MPLSVKLAACLHLLGFADDAEIQWDHAPALGLRAQLPDGSYDPPANDSHHIVPRLKGDHERKTFGPGGEKRITTAGSDIHAMKKQRHLSEAIEEHRRKMLAKGAPESERLSGKAAGGHARAKALTAQERSNIARKAANARWKRKLPTKEHPFGQIVEREGK